MRVLFDTNVVLDLLLDREPFSETAAYIFSKVEKGEVAGFLGATTITTIHYLALKVIGPERTRHEIRKLLTLFEIAPVNKIVLESAGALKLPDFEDAVLHEAAKYADVRAIVTRDVTGFKGATTPVYSPIEFAKILS